jgi:hypothetical protein
VQKNRDDIQINRMHIAILEEKLSVVQRIKEK